VESEGASSWACCWPGVLQCSAVSEVAVPLYVVPALVVATTTGGVVIEGSGQLRLLEPGVGEMILDKSYLIRTQCCRHQQSQEGSRLREETASSPRRVVRAAIGDVPAGTGTVVLAVCMGSAGQWAQSILLSVCVGSRPRRGVVGRRPARGRCRVPYWQDAWPWGRTKSRVTAGAA
jgi:hypothetical protein